MTDEQVIDLAHALALVLEARTDSRTHGELIGIVEAAVSDHLEPAVYAVLPDPS